MIGFVCRGYSIDGAGCGRGDCRRPPLPLPPPSLAGRAQCVVRDGIGLCCVVAFGASRRGQRVGTGTTRPWLWLGRMVKIDRLPACLLACLMGSPSFVINGQSYSQ